MDLQHSEDYFVRLLFGKVKIKEVMKSPAISIYENEDLSLAHEKFVEFGLSHLIVVDKKNKLTGILSPKYVYKAKAPKKRMDGELILEQRAIIDGDSFYEKDSLDRHSLKDIMFRTPFTLDKDNILGEAVLSMSNRNVSCIPIIEKDRTVVGVLTNQEIVNFLTKILTE